MTQTNQIKKSDDFKLIVVLRVESQNSRAIVLRFAAITVAMIAAASKIAVLILGKIP